MGGKGEAQQSITAQKSQQELLLEKITSLLDDTDPDRWRKGGTELNEEDRFEKPRQTWENCYTFEISKGILLVRASTPVKSDFQGRGFMLIPIGPPIYTIEIRAAGWHHSELTDPYKRSRIADRRCDVLAEGSVAQKIYAYVESAYHNYHTNQQQAFDKVAYDFVSRLPNKLKDETVNRWERIEDTPGDVHYVATYDDIKVDVGRNFLQCKETYTITVTKQRVKSVVRDAALAKELFSSVEDLGATSRLMTLTKALEFD